jgi:hypothetical protein
MLKKLLLLVVLLGANVYADYESGKAIFKAKCSSCHAGYISMDVLKENFYEKDNQLLKLVYPSENMLAYAITRGPLHVGDKSDPDMQKIEIEEYLKRYLYNPRREDSVCDPEISKHYDIKESLKGKVSEEEISHLTDFFFEYRKERLKTNPKEVKNLSHSNDASEILKQAKAENKTIMVEAMSLSCHFCKIMEDEVFSKDPIQEALDKDFIFLSIDVDKTKLPFGLDKEYKGMTPTFFTLTPDGKVLNVYPGAWTKEDFSEILNENKR